MSPVSGAAAPDRRGAGKLACFDLACLKLDRTPKAAWSAPRLGTLAWRRFPGLIFHAGILALRCLRGPQRLADKRLAQNQPCLGNVAEQKHGFDGFAWLCIAAIERHHGTSAFAFDLANPAAEALAPANAGRHLDPCFPPKGAPEIRDADERAIDPRRGNFEAIGPFYRFLDIEDGRESRAHDFAIIEVHRPVGTFRHDLHRHSRLRRKLDPDQPVSETGQNRLRNMGHTRGNPGFLDQARFIEDALRLRFHALAVAIQTLPVHRRFAPASEISRNHASTSKEPKRQ